MPEKKLSEEAQWFLRNLQKLQDDFAESVGAQIVTTDREGNLVTKDEISPVTEEEVKKRTGRLSKLISILAEESALREVFEVA